MIILLLSLLIAAFIIRFHVNAYRLGYNPVVDKLNQLTDPMVLPFKRLFPVKRYDMAALIPGLIIAILGGYTFHSALLQYNGILPVIPRSPGTALLIGINLLFISTWLQVIFFTMLVTVIGSWLQTDPRQPVMQIALSCSDWLLAPIRRILPSLGGLDFSPIIALFAIQFAQQGILKMTYQLLARSIGQ